MIYFLIKGFLLGFGIAFPVGPVTLLCFKNTLSKGAISGILTGLGSSIGIGIFGAFTGFGCTFLATFLERYGIMFNLCGALILLTLGIQTFLKKIPPSNTQILPSRASLSDGLLPLLLTVINPMTAIVFLSLYSSFGLTSLCGNLLLSILFTASVFLGGITWFMLLTFAIVLLRQFIDYRKIILFNKSSALVLFMFAGFSLYQALKLLSLG